MAEYLTTLFSNILVEKSEGVRARGTRLCDMSLSI
jgi:hypothetical protein